MATDEDKTRSYGLTIIGIVALISVVSLVALVLNIGGVRSATVERVVPSSASTPNAAGNAYFIDPGNCWYETLCNNQTGNGTNGTGFCRRVRVCA